MQSESRSFKCSIPWMMAGARAVLGPVMMLGERSGWSGLTLAAMVVAALLSDIFDGVLARRWKCDTPSVRLFDSMADIVFYIGCGAALFMRCPQLLRSFSIPIMAVIGLEALCISFAIIKFGKPPSYHSYLAKSWGLALATTLVLSFAATNTLTVQIAWWASCGLGAFACLEGFAISLIMPEWRHDLKTLWRALAVRRYILLDRKRDSRRRSRLRLATIAAILIATVTASASASSIDGVTFSGGTAPGVTTGAEGELETGDRSTHLSMERRLACCSLRADSEFKLSRQKGAQSGRIAPRRCSLDISPDLPSHSHDYIPRRVRSEAGRDLPDSEAGNRHAAGRIAGEDRSLRGSISAAMPVRCRSQSSETTGKQRDRRYAAALNESARVIRLWRLSL
jgi:phosphatidylglycerophosphate synthase